MSTNHAAEELARNALAVDWVAASCVALLLYDHIITFGQECTRIWPSRTSMPKYLFFLNRYLVEAMLVVALTDLIVSLPRALIFLFPCIFYLRWLSVVTTVATIVIEAILTLRVWALYQSNKLILVGALFLFFAGAGTLVGLTIADYVHYTVSAVDDFDYLPGCYATSVPPIIAGYWITPVIVESVLFVLIIVRTFTWWKDRHAVPPTLVLMARDSTIYFAIYFTLLIANLFFFEYGPPSLDSLMVTPLNTGGCIAGSRMLLNLRAQADHESTEMVSTVNFARSCLPRDES